MINAGNKVKNNAGFTFAELVVVISIFTILSGVVLFNFSDFSAAVSLQNLAQDIALQIKEAQTAAISGRLSGSYLEPEGWKPSYGVYFELAKKKSFVYFADLNGDGEYFSNDDFMMAEIAIQTESEIYDLCVNDGFKCGLDDLSVTFTRPFPEASFKSSSLASSSSIARAEMIIKSPEDKFKRVIVWATGQISAK